MIYYLDVMVVLTALGIAVLGAVYVWSSKADRRTRAWQLIKLLLRK